MSHYNHNCVTLSITCSPINENDHRTMFTVRSVPMQVINGEVTNPSPQDTHTFSIPNLSYPKTPAQQQLIDSVMAALDTYMESLHG